MTLGKYFTEIERFTRDHSPVILTGLGVSGVLVTAVLTARATLEAAQMLADQGMEINGHSGEIKLTRDDFWDVYRLYIPPVISGVASTTCIIMANRVGTRRTAAVAAAYSVSERAFEQYRAKMVDHLGKNKERAARDEIAQDRVNNTPVPKNQLAVVGDGKVLCFDAYSGRYFHSDMQTIRRAENEVNFKVLNELYASLSDFYEQIGLSATKSSEDVGWTTDMKLTVDISAVVAENEQPCLSIDFRVAPVRDYWKFN